MFKVTRWFTQVLCLSLVSSPLTQAFASPNVYVRSNGQFVANGNEYARGFWVPAIQGAEQVFSGSPVALEEYQEHIRAAKYFSILNWGAVGAFAAYAIISASGNNYNGGIGLAIFVVPWVSGLYFAAKSNQHLIRAINITNGVGLEQASRPQPKAIMAPLLAWSF